MFARALAYDLVKNSARDKSTFEEVVEQKAAPAPRTTTNIYNTQQTPVIDLWTPLKSLVDAAMTSKQTVLGENVPNQQYGIIKDIIIERNPSVKDSITPKDIKLQQSTDGGAIVAYSRKTNKPLATFTQEDFDIAANKALGVKATTEAVRGRGGAAPAAKPKQKFVGVPPQGF